MKMPPRLTMISLLLASAAWAMPAATQPQLVAAQYVTSADANTKNDLIDTAAHTGAFRTLVQAAEAVGVDEELRGDGPYTVFAPTDAAFAKLPAGTVDRLMQPENREELVSLLKLHVVAGEKMTTADLDGQKTTAETLNGSLAIDASDPISGVRVNNAGVTLSDIEASNGVIHAIDTVLLPGPSAP